MKKFLPVLYGSCLCHVHFPSLLRGNLFRQGVLVSHHINFFFPIIYMSCELSATFFWWLGDKACILINFSMEDSIHKILSLHRKEVKTCYSGLSQTQMRKLSREKSQSWICTADLCFILTSEGVPCSRCVQTMQQKSAMQITDPQCRSDTRILLTGW